MPKSPLERLHRRILRQEKVPQADIESTIAEEDKALREEYKDNKYELQKRLLGLNSFKVKILAEKDNLQEAYKAGRLDFFKDSRKLWREAVPEIAALKDRPNNFSNAIRDMNNMTDVSRDGENVIEDYEGWGPGWVTERSNNENETRYTLSGYLTAYQMHDPRLAANEYVNAYNAYSHWTGSVLKYSELKEDMQMGKYLETFDIYKNLEDQPKGYLAGCLKISAEIFPQTHQLYSEYLRSSLVKLINAGKLKAPSEDMNKWQKGDMQLRALSSIFTPKEWLESAKTVRDDFVKFRDTVNQLGSALGFALSPDVLEFLKRNPMSITNDDAEKLSDFKDQVAAEAFAKVNEKKTELGKEVGKVEDKLKKVEGKNAKKKKYTADQINNLKTNLGKAKADLAAIVLAGSTTFDDLVSANSNLEAVKSTLHSTNITLDSMLAGFAVVVRPGPGGGPGPGPGARPSGADIYKSGWANAELVDSIWKNESVRVAPTLTASIAARDNNGNVVEHIPPGTNLTIVDVNAKARKVEGGTFVKVEYNGKQVWVDEGVLVLGDAAPESSERMEFLKEKYLLEISIGKRYGYVLDVRDQEFEKGIDFKNREVKRAFGNKFNRLMRSILKKVPEDEAKAEMAKLLREPEKLTREKVFKTVGKIIEKHAGKAEAERFASAIMILKKASIDSTMVFSGKPSLSELETKYRKQFVPAWEKAGRAMDKLMKEPTKKPKEGVPESTKAGSKMNPEVKKMLGKIKPAYKYAEASNEIIKYTEDPEKYPGGINIRLPLNDAMVPALIRFKNGLSGAVTIKYLTHPSETRKYPSMRSLLRHMHNGYLLASRQFTILGSEASYKQYENYIGPLDDLDKDVENRKDITKGVYTHRIEFDWEGTDPDIWVRPLNHGRIQYHIDYGDVGYKGGDIRKGVAENFNALIRICKRSRNWANRFDNIPDRSKASEARKERMYDKLVKPQTFRSHYKKVGRVVQQITNLNGVNIKLDWGGGNDLNSRANAKLKVWIGSGGRLNYRLYREDFPRIDTSGTASSIEGVVDKVAKIRKGKKGGKK